jgi:hypothetical protein
MAAGSLRQISRPGRLRLLLRWLILRLARGFRRPLAQFLDSLVKLDELGVEPLLVRVKLPLPLAQFGYARGKFG